MRKLTQKQLTKLNDSIFLQYMTDKYMSTDEIQVYHSTTEQVAVISRFFIAMSKILNKHPQKLYPNQQLNKKS